MSLLVLGSAAYDTIDTPYGHRDRTVGGSGVYASFAASFFTSVQLIGVVGTDWNQQDSEFLRNRGIDLTGLEIRSGEKTLYWSGHYFDNMNDRETLQIDLNVMGQEYNPIVPDNYKNTPFVFLANGGPGIHSSLLRQIARPQLVIADTMDFYIQHDLPGLLALMKEIDGMILNDSEVKLLTGIDNYLKAANEVLKMGPRFVIVKKGEHGATYFDSDDTFMIPAYPTQEVVDPTGAGDSFAGALMGYLASQANLTSRTMRHALAYATVIASFNVEGFGTERFREITLDVIETRFQKFRNMCIW